MTEGAIEIRAVGMTKFSREVWLRWHTQKKANSQAMKLPWACTEQISYS